ncbi:MAG: hypothetical protein QM760_10560 [Nibricoccus sp.]
MNKSIADRRGVPFRDVRFRASRHPLARLSAGKPAFAPLAPAKRPPRLESLALENRQCRRRSSYQQHHPRSSGRDRAAQGPQLLFRSR